ncbi:MAG: GlsB/YeaQ/YmgE family stress response membrane protein [Rikenellaceae bacterium]|nr:GlsB/YeaQ/YmgE family stress response membrane protein [Rikenellaceae bacterium]
MYYLWFLLIGLVAGWLASLLVKGHGSGLLLNLVVGVIGSFIGGWILSLFGLFVVGTAGSLIAAIIGAIVLLWIASAISNSSAKNRRQK